MAKTEFTSTDRHLLYKVRFSPGGEEFYVEAGGAVSAQQKGIGLAALNDVSWNGIDTNRASEEEAELYFDAKPDAKPWQEEE